MKNENIHRSNIQEVFDSLNTSIRGLSEEEARSRLEKYGYNEIKEIKKKPLLVKFLANFIHLLAILLWVAAALCFISGSPELGWSIIGVIVINALFSFWQEFKAEQATERLKHMLPAYVKVIRDGRQKLMLAKDLVPGDIIYLEEGDNVSADARLIESFEMRVVNAALTGESQPIGRNSETIFEEDIPLIEAPNIVFTGTSIASGSGTAVVFSTAMNTQFGRIASLTQTIKEEQSPLQKQLEKVARVIALLCLAMGISFFFLGLLTGKPLKEAFILTIGILTANVPEGLLPTVTLALAMGVQRMAQRHALVKKLSSVETLGGATVICTDKTGTLTQNEMTVKHIWTALDHYEVTGVGYNPKGELTVNGKPLESEKLRRELDQILKIGAFCNNSRLNKPSADNPAWTIVGDPTEGALIVLLEKAGISLEAALQSSPRVFQLPFDSRRKRMTSLHQHQEQFMAFTKGGPKEVLSVCSAIWKGEEKIDRLSDSDLKEIIAQNDKFAKAGLRVLALAYKNLPERAEEFTVENTENDLVFVGLVAMLDPPRPEVEEAVKSAQKAGIKIIMITGDYGLTAESIAKRIGILKSEQPKIITGAELDGMTEESLKAELKNPEILFARVAPEHKMMVVSALKAMGEVVAVTGDGVNDAPALKRADIGVAMGKSGTDVAREVATMVLTDDNFASIVHAIEEGRAVFDNVRKFIVYILAHLTPEAIPYVLFSLFNIPLPITVMQILAIDLGTETFPALALGVEPPEPGVMERPPRSPKENLLNSTILFRGYLLLGLINTLAVLAGYFWVLYSGGWQWGQTLPAGALLARQAATMTFLGIVIMQVANVFACRTEVASIFKIGLFSNRFLLFGIVFELVFTALLIYIPFLQGLFGTAALGIKEWLFYLPFIPLLVSAEEIRKGLVRRRLKVYSNIRGSGK